LYNWLLARQTNGQFLIRVEDTDEARSTRESEASILNDLKWLGLTWDEGPEVGGPHGPYRQSERKDIYLKYAEQLMADGHAYRCFCTEEELETKRAAAEAAGVDPKYDGTWRDADPAEVQRRLANGDPFTVRFKVPPGKVCFIDDIVRGRVTWDADASLGDFIILRSSGMPVYNFCVAVDDASMKITHVVRAEEHLTNTLRQLLILEALGYTPPTYAHCSLILGSDRSKLSKRHGATSCKQFSEQGFLPDAMVNYLAALGWNDGTNKEIYSKPELISAFNLNRIIKSPAVFDMERLKWVNSQHIKNVPLSQLEVMVGDVFDRAEPPLFVPAAAAAEEAQEQKRRLISLASKMSQEKMELVVDALAITRAVLAYPLEETLRSDPHVTEILEDGFDSVVAALLRDFESGSLPRDGATDSWKAYMKSLGKELGRKGKRLFHPVRLALTGTMSGPDVGEQLQVLGTAAGLLDSAVTFVDIAERMTILKTVDLKAKV